MKEFRGCKVPKATEPDYDGLRVAHCNSVPEKTCDELDCSECLFDESNADLFQAWTDKNLKKKLEKYNEVSE